MIHQSIIETILLAIGLMCSQYYVDTHYKPQLAIVDTYQDTVYVYNKNNYFCPKYCEIHHTHLIHHSEYKGCSVGGSDGPSLCNHFTYNQLVSEVSEKRRRHTPKMNGLPLVSLD